MQYIQMSAGRLLGRDVVDVRSRDAETAGPAAGAGAVLFYGAEVVGEG